MSASEPGPLIFALNLLYAVGAPYQAVEIAAVIAIVKRGLTRQPDSQEEACFLSDRYIAERIRVDPHTVKRWMAKHVMRDRPVLSRSWPGHTVGDDGKRHVHESARYTLLRTEAQVDAARAAEWVHQQLEQDRAAKRYRSTLDRQLAASGRWTGRAGRRAGS